MKPQQLQNLTSLPEEFQDTALTLVEQLNNLIGNLKAVYSNVKEINAKEVVTYKEDLSELVKSLETINESINGKEYKTIVNIPLEKLSEDIKNVEKAIKAIKQVEIPEYPNTLSLNEDQLNALLLEIQAIPPFPYKELENLILGLGKKISEIKLEEQEFDYDRLDRKFNELVRAVKNVSITVGGGGGIGDRANTNLDTIASNTSSVVDNSWVSSNIDTADSTYYYFLSFIPGTTKWRINRLNKTTYVSDYATGESSIATAWTDRASQTYLTIY